jgi:hypothetical protein
MSTVLIIISIWFLSSPIVGILLGRFMARTQSAYPVVHQLTLEDTQPRPITFSLRPAVDD